MLQFSLNRQRSHGSLFDKGVYPADFTEDFKQYIRKRDKDRCSICGRKRKPREHNLDVHHINFRKETDKRNCISLCRGCHNEVHRQRWNKWFWIDALQALVNHREKANLLGAQEKRALTSYMRNQIKVR